MTFPATEIVPAEGIPPDADRSGASGPRVTDYRAMLLIRRTEELILRMFSEGRIHGTTHTCIGQEANAVAIMSQLDPNLDFVISNHRCHGHFLAFGGPVEGLLAEIMGRATGICAGRGGSQHLKWGRFFSNGVLGGGGPIACGLALAEKLRGGRGIVVWCLGDGALGEGVVYESMNLAALWNLPILFLVEHNGYAQSTPSALEMAGSAVDRARPFGIHADEISTTDVALLRRWGARLVDAVRGRRKPAWGVVHTYRFSAHSKGDDHRPAEEIARRREKDPLLVHGLVLSDAEKEEAEAWVAGVLGRAEDAAARAPLAVFREDMP